MKIERIVNGYLEENCYIIYNNLNECLIIDPGSEGEKIEKFIKEKKLNVISFLITHYHFDHIGALEYLKEKYNCKINDYKNVGDIKISSFKFKVIQNFGHTLDSCSFYFYNENVMFTGDFIFKDTIGNYDFKNKKYMLDSLKEFKNIDKDIKIYPGHYDETSVFYEHKNNIYLKEL